MKFTKVIKSEDQNALARYVYQQLEDIKNGIVNARVSGNMTIDTLKGISHHLSNARLLINTFINK